jgi:hypothetical protein
MKNITVQCDRCGKMINGQIGDWPYQTYGYVVVTEGLYEPYKRWEEDTICEQCLWADKKYITATTSQSWAVK